MNALPSTTLANRPYHNRSRHRFGLGLLGLVAAVTAVSLGLRAAQPPLTQATL